MARIKKDNVETFFENDLDLDSRTIYLGSQVGDDGEDLGLTARIAENVIKGLHILNNQSPEGDRLITLIINCPGGDVYNGLGILGAIENSINPVRIVVKGYAMSMGAWIFQAGEERIIDKRATLMIHYGWAQYSGHSKGMKHWAKEEERLNTEMENDLLKRIKEKHPRFTRDALQKRIQHDLILSAEEAVEFGLADKII